MMRRIIFAILCVSVSTSCGRKDGEFDEFIRENSTQELTRMSAKILSRRKRYLIFPEGSSLQLVYCLTMPVIGEKTIFTIGGTAALAWELPHDPFQPYRKRAELLHRNDPPGKYTINDPISNEKQSPAKLAETLDRFASAPIRYGGYQNPISAPSARFPTINYSPAYNRYRYRNYQNRRRQQIPHQQQFDTEAWNLAAPVNYRFAQPKLPIQSIQRAKNDRVTPVNNARGDETFYTPASRLRPSIYHQVHRRTRRDLYGKIEKFLSAQRQDGKACLLRAICEIHQKGEEKGSFMEEIFKAVLRVKATEHDQDEDNYDHAANKDHNCTELYSNCESSILNFI